MLGRLLYDNPDELMADMQQTYQLDVREWPRDPMWYATLATQLGPGARVNDSVTVADEVLCAIEYDVRSLTWSMSKDAKSGRNKPKPIELRPRAKQTRGMTSEDFERYRNAKLGGESNGRR